MRGTQMEKIIE